MDTHKPTTPFARTPRFDAAMRREELLCAYPSCPNLRQIAHLCWEHQYRCAASIAARPHTGHPCIVSGCGNLAWAGQPCSRCSEEWPTLAAIRQARQQQDQQQERAACEAILRDIALEEQRRQVEAAQRDILAWEARRRMETQETQREAPRAETRLTVEGETVRWWETPRAVRCGYAVALVLLAAWAACGLPAGCGR